MSADGMIVASGLTTAVRDIGQLGPLVAAIAATTGECCLLGVGREGKAPTRWPQGRETPRLHRVLRPPWAARARYARRKTQAERPHAEITGAMGFRRFALCGVAQVRGGWALVCAAFDRRRLRALPLTGA